MSMQTIILWKLDPQTNVASVKSRGNDKDGGSNNISKNKHTGRLFQQRRCDCIFDDDKIHSVQLTKNGNYMMDSDDTDNTNLESLFAIRSKVFFEFDCSGRDWGDVPRGLNLYYSPTYKFIINPKLKRCQ